MTVDGVLRVSGRPGPGIPVDPSGHASERVACFAAGTRILTAHGEVPVEALTVGHRAITARGVAVPIVWLGFRRLECGRHPRPDQVMPVRVRAGAFGAGAPHRDLLLSPDHAVPADGMLIPVRRLINGVSIARQEVDGITYWHVELPSHDIILAEGLPVESCVDATNRDAFSNGGTVIRLHPDFGPAHAAVAAPDASRVEPVWHRLAERAGIARKPVPRAEPLLCAVAAGRWLQPLAVVDGSWSYAIPHGATTLRLVSPTALLNDLHPWLDDRRRLGLQLAGIVLEDETGAHPLALDHPDLERGWWECERTTGRTLRWTGGDATIRIAPSCLRAHLEIASAVPGARWRQPETGLRAPARLLR